MARLRLGRGGVEVKFEYEGPVTIVRADGYECGGSVECGELNLAREVLRMFDPEVRTQAGMPGPWSWDKDEVHGNLRITIERLP